MTYTSTSAHFSNLDSSAAAEDNNSTGTATDEEEEEEEGGALEGEKAEGEVVLAKPWFTTKLEAGPYARCFFSAYPQLTIA